MIRLLFQQVPPNLGGSALLRLSSSQLGIRQATQAARKNNLYDFTSLH